VSENINFHYPQDSIQLIKPNSPKLSQAAEPINKEEIASDQFQQFLAVMLRFAKGEQGDTSRTVLVGLAAPQVGIMKRIILVDTGADGKGDVSQLQAYINPEIVEASREEEEWYEGCYSTGNVTGIVSRPSKVTVKALDRYGNEIIEEHHGYIARIFQHEIDHLDGVRFPSKVAKEENLHKVEPHEFPRYRNQEGWRTLQKKCSWEEWKKIAGNFE